MIDSNNQLDTPPKYEHGDEIMGAADVYFSDLRAGFRTTLPQKF
jgi:hypothetical protein